MKVRLPKKNMDHLKSQLSQLGQWQPCTYLAFAGLLVVRFARAKAAASLTSSLSLLSSWTICGIPANKCKPWVQTLPHNPKHSNLQTWQSPVYSPWVLKKSLLLEFSLMAEIAWEAAILVPSLSDPRRVTRHFSTSCSWKIFLFSAFINQREKQVRIFWLKRNFITIYHLTEAICKL